MSLALAVAIALQAPPANPPGSFMIYGFQPPSSCGQWATARRGNGALAEALEGWVLGVVTGYNRYGPTPGRDIAAGTDTAGMLAWIDQYCSAHPLDSITVATFALIEELQRRNRAAVAR